MFQHLIKLFPQQKGKGCFMHMC